MQDRELSGDAPVITDTGACEKTFPADGSGIFFLLHQLLHEQLIHTLQSKHSKIAVIADEHGVTAGIVTMSDISEQIVGRIDDEFVHDDDQDAVRMEDGSYLLEGTMPIDDLVELMDFTPEEAAECETAAGLLLALFDRIPQAGDTVEIEHADAREITHVKFSVVMMDRLRIDKIRMSVKTVAKEEDE